MAVFLEQSGEGITRESHHRHRGLAHAAVDFVSAYWRGRHACIRQDLAW